MGISRPYQFIWLVGTLIFFIAVYSTTQAGIGKQWVSTTTSTTTAATGSGVIDPSSYEIAQLSGRPSLADHIQLSNKIWAKTVRQRHQMLKDWDVTADMPMFPADTIEHYFEHPYSIWDFFPASWSCPFEMERIGRLGDGGKWVCGMSKYEQLPASRPCVVYSFGVQTESSYEDETIERTHCEVWAYDFSVTDFGKQLTPEHKMRAHFMKAGIDGKTDKTQDPPFYTIQDLMKMNGHDYIDILKMDIEFSEFSSLTSLEEAFPASKGSFPIGQLLVELHLFAYKGEMNPAVFLKWWEMLENRGMRPTWTEPNLLYTTLKLENQGDPRLAEYTFVNLNDRRSVLFGEYYARRDAAVTGVAQVGSKATHAFN